MIIRILGEGQFEIDDKQIVSLNRIDNEIVNHVSNGDAIGFRGNLAELITMVKNIGEPLNPAQIIPSDIIIPPDDLSIDEAKKIFSGQGLIKD